MTWVAVAVVGGTVVGGAIAAHGATSAANTQAAAAGNAQQISQNEFNTITAQNQPYMNSGYGALSALNWGLGLSGGPAAPAPSGFTAPTSTGSISNAFTGGVNNFGVPFTGAYQHPGGALYAPNAPSSGGTQGIDPSSGYRIGAGGSISQLIAPPAGTVPPAATPSGMPATGTPGPGGLGYGSLLTPFDINTFRAYSPAYQFQQQQGMNGVLNSDTSGQGALSGATMKDLIGYNQNLANTSFNSAFNQYQTQQGNIFSRLSGIAQLGQASANNTGQQGTALAGQAAQSATNIGTAQAAGQVGAANAISGSISSALPWLTRPTTSVEVPDESMGVGG